MTKTDEIEVFEVFEVFLEICKGETKKKSQQGMVKNSPSREDSPTHQFSSNFMIFFQQFSDIHPHF